MCEIANSRHSIDPWTVIRMPFETAVKLKSSNPTTIQASLCPLDTHWCTTYNLYIVALGAMCDEDAYARSLARIAAAQIVYAQVERVSERSHAAAAAGGSGGGGKGRPRTLNATGTQATAAVADAMAEVLGAFVQAVGRRARARAELSGRTICSLPDVTAALEMSARATRTHTRDLAQYARYERIVFPRPVPAFPATPRGPKKRAREEEEVTTLPGSEPWMPALPPAHTYVVTPPVVDGNDGKSRSGRADLAAQRRAVEQSLARLQGVGKPGRGLPAAAAAALEVNPFLRPPGIGVAPLPGDEERAEPRLPIEPLVEHPPEMSDSNRAHTERDAKRSRIERVLREPGSVTGISAAATAAHAAAIAEIKNKSKDGGGSTKSGTSSKGSGTSKSRGGGSKGGKSNGSKSSNGKSGNSKGNGKGGSNVPDGLVPLSAVKK